MAGVYWKVDRMRAKQGSEKAMAWHLVLVLLLPPVVVPPLTSLVAPVVKVNGDVPGAVGVPVTLQVMAAPMATVPLVGTVGVQLVLKPAGKPAIAQVAPTLAAAVAAGAVLVQV